MHLGQLPIWLRTVACGLLLLLLHVQGKNSVGPIRTTLTGQVRGSLVHVKGTDVGVHTFLGIPFAKPPEGPLQFAPPKPAAPWSGVREGTSHPAMCLQTSDIMNTDTLKQLNPTLPPVSMSEDCLYLSIYSPAYAHEGSNLPVVVWIHGGALVAGMASSYDASILAGTENVVVVAIQYRLCVLGFFRWCQPVCLWQVNSEALVHCLRGKSEEEILAINKPFTTIPGVVDGAFLPWHPRELLVSADFHPVPSIIGVNTDEYGFGLPLYMGYSETIKEINRGNFPAFIESMTANMGLPAGCGGLLMEEYMGDTEDPQILQANFHELMADFMFMIPALQVAHFQHEYICDRGLTAIGETRPVVPGSLAPVYFYEFQHQSSIFKDIRPPHVKADHGDEVSFVFRYYLNSNTDFTEEEDLLSRRMMKFWANFARNGNPNSDYLPPWPWLYHDQYYLKLDIQPALGQALKADRLQFDQDPAPEDRGAYKA